MVKTGLSGDQFNNEWCHFSTTIALCNQAVHYNDKAKKSCQVSLYVSLSSHTNINTLLSTLTGFFTSADVLGVLMHFNQDYLCTDSF